MFIEPDEHIIIMEDDTYIPLNVDHLKALEDAGIKTVMLPHALYWDAQINELNKKLETILQTNLKVLVPFFYGFPKSYSIRQMKGDDEYFIPDYANDYVGEKIDEVANIVMDYYEDIRSRIQFTFAIPDGGEFLWDAYKTKDFIPDEIIFKFIIDRQKILFQQHGEVWLHLNNFLGDPENWNNTHMRGLYRAIRKEFPDAPFYSVQFSYFNIGNSTVDFPQHLPTMIYQRDFNIKFFVGSEFCEGLVSNYEKHKMQNLWGFITAPLHSQNKIKHTSIEPWMVDIIRETNRKLLHDND